MTIIIIHGNVIEFNNRIKIIVAFHTKTHKNVYLYVIMHYAIAIDVFFY